VVCSLGANDTSTSPSEHVPAIVDVIGPDDNVTMATARCELTQPISNASSTLIQIVLDVVDITDAHVSPRSLLAPNAA